MNRIVFILMALTVNTYAQNLSYDNFPDADPPYYRVRYNASDRPGELVFPVSYTIWIPSGVETLRGVIVHQHGCGWGSCTTGLTGAYDLHWQALAKKHQCALLGPSYEQSEGGDCVSWCDPRNGSDLSFQKSLKDLGTLSGHPELATVPWALWGHSGGGAWVGFMTLLHPDRVAAVWLNSGIPIIANSTSQPDIDYMDFPDEALEVPMMCNLGTQEGVTVKEGKHAKRWKLTEQFFRTVRAKGGLIGVAVDPLTAHSTGNQRYLAIPWFDACLEQRLPLKGDKPLRKISKKEAWLATPLGTKAYPQSQYSGDKNEAVWLPNKAVAKAWEHYIRDTEIPDSTPPPSPFNIDVKNGCITWEAEADLESGIAYFVIVGDDKEIATVRNENVNPFSRPVFQGINNSDSPLQPLQKMSYTDTIAISNNIYVFTMYSVNTVGLRSE